jgi:hypothetical protein
VSQHLCQGDWVEISTKNNMHFGKYGLGFLEFLFFLFSSKEEVAHVSSHV